MYCPNCGLNNPDNALNCSACGAALGAQAPGAAPPGYTHRSTGCSKIKIDCRLVGNLFGNLGNS